MTLLRRMGMLGASVTVVAIATAAPAPAADAPPADGYYTYSEAGKPPAEWRLQSICAQASGTREQSDYSNPEIQTLGCTVNMGSAPQNLDTQDEKLLKFGDRMRLSGGQWTAEPPFPAGQLCDDGSTAPLRQVFKFSGETLTGERTVIWGDECGRQPGMTKTPFTLTFTAPLDPPVDNRFPMQCDYLVGRPSICS